jgi:hypothetical protein
MATPYTAGDLTAGDHADPDNPLERHFTRNWVVTEDNPVAGMKTVAVTVSFETANRDSAVTMTTYITSRR